MIAFSMSTAAAQRSQSSLGKRLPPGPSGLKLYLSLSRAPRDWLGFLAGLAKDHGDISFFRILNVPVCFISRPEHIESVLVSDFRHYFKSKDYVPLKAVIGDGLITSEGEFWRRQRQLVQPAFHSERIAAYGKIMVGYAEKMIAAWRDGETRDVHHDMMKLTLDIVTKTLFNADVASEAADIGNAIEVAMNHFANLGWFSMFLPRSMEKPGQLLFRKTARRLDDIIYRIIRSRRESGGDSGDLLSMLFQAQAEDGGRMTDKQLRDEMMTLLLAGHETTANALAWTWYLLSLHPEVEERLHSELRTVLGRRSPQLGDLQQLRYTQMVIKESLRLFPPAWGIGRETLREVQLGEYHLPAGTNVFISQWVTQRDPRYFDRPEDFVPERWTEEFERRLPKFAYFPFGGGPRVCIGASFANMEAALLLATIAQRFRLALVAEHPITPFASAALRPKHGIRVTLHKHQD